MVEEEISYPKKVDQERKPIYQNTSLSHTHILELLELAHIGRHATVFPTCTYAWIYIGICTRGGMCT